jgi:type I restriction enzyme S subunit
VTEDRDNLPELPTGWVWAKTGDICEGIVPGRTKPKNFNGTIPWITLPDFTGLYISKSKNNLAVTREDAEEVGMRVMPKGTVLMSCVGQFGIICIAEDDLVPNQQFHGFLCLDKIFPEYIAYSLMTQVDQMEQLSSATTIAYINKTKCNSIQIPLAPLNEQRRIVAKIEALKARSQRVKEELEAIPALLDQFRQSVLAAAFRGDLTADWREKNPDVEPASVLLERIRAERRRRWEEAELEKMKAQGKTPKDDKWKEKYKEPESLDDFHLPELPDKWCWATLDQLLFSLRNGLSKRPEDQPPGIPILRISAVRSMEVNTSDIRFYPIDAAEDISSYLLQSGDLLFTRYNGSRSFVGVCGLLPNLTDDLLYPDKLIRGQVVDKLLCLSEYLELACNFGVSRSHIDSHIKTSAGQQGIAGSDLKCTPIPLPPVAEQYKIVQGVNQQFSATQSLAAMADESAKNVQLLDQSILAKAFRGELVPQDPNDESASVLLERIRAEREKLDTKKKAKGKSEKKSRKAKPEAAEPEQLSLPGFE